MSSKIADYGLVSDMKSAALISSKGNVAWLCWPDFDSEACFASLLGSSANGRWLVAPAKKARSQRRYIASTNVLETTYYDGVGGKVTVTDFMPIHAKASALVRIVRGVTGSVRMHTMVSPRFDYGSAQPRIIQKGHHCWNAVVGPHRLTLHSNVSLELEGGDLAATWVVAPGEAYFFTLQHSNSYLDGQPEPFAATVAQQNTEEFWKKWAGKNTYRGAYKDLVERSLLTLKGTDLFRLGWVCGCAHHLLAGKGGGCSQLGLPFLLASRHDFQPAWDGTLRALRRRGVVAGVAQPFAAGLPRKSEDHVWHNGKTGAQ